MLWRRIDLLVNNAGVFIPKPFAEYTSEDFRRAIETNLWGFFYVSQLAASQMRLQKSYQHFLRCTSDADDRSGCFACLC